jgi:hypothetical protein
MLCGKQKFVSGAVETLAGSFDGDSLEKDGD